MALEENIRIYNNGTVFVEELMLLKVKIIIVW